ncbi:MAG: hypothetical protein GY765_28570 [bacterium]|nr:hypothetical protein [bacterium]
MVVKKTKRTCLPGFLLLALLVTLLAGIGTGCGEKPTGSTETAQKGNQPAEKPVFPTFGENDSKGNLVTHADFSGKYVFVQFIDGNSTDDIDLLENVFLNWVDEGLAIIAIPKDLETLKERVGVQLDEIVVFDHDYKKMQQIFGAPSCCEAFFLYDPQGRLVKTDFNREGYQGGVKSQLDRLIKNEYFKINELITEKKNIRDFQWLAMCNDIMKKDRKDFYVVSMMTNVCNTCLSGVIIEQLAKWHTTSADRVGVMTVVPASYTDTDIANLKTFLGIDYRLLRADDKFQQEWSNRIEKYRESQLTNILFLVDKDGTVLKVTGNEQDHLREFFAFSHPLIKEKSDTQKGKKS